MTVGDRSSRGSSRGFVLGLLLLAAAVRVPGIFTQLWLDEVWTWWSLTRIDSAAAIILDLHNSNNHHLNSLWYYGLGPDAPWAAYRLHSLAAGVAVVFFSWRIGSRFGRVHGGIAGWLSACSFLLIHFSSEGRGYSLAAAAALGSLLSAHTFLDGRNTRAGVAGFAVCSVVGFLSHLTYLSTFIAIGVWLGFAVLLDREERGRGLGKLTGFFALPTLFLAIFTLFVARDISIGTGEPTHLWNTLIQLLSYTAGGPGTGISAAGLAERGGGSMLIELLVAMTALGLIVASISWVRRRRDSSWIFYAGAIFLAPISVAVLASPELLPVRWFIIPVAISYVVVGALLGALWERGARAPVAAILLLFVAGNALHVAELWQRGRGSYVEALNLIAQRTPGPRARVTSDQNFRNRMLIAYYERFLPEGERVEYVPTVGTSAPWPEWAIRHKYGGEPIAPTSIQDPTGRAFNLVASFPSADLSGFHWFVYRASDHQISAPRARGQHETRQSR